MNNEIRPALTAEEWRHWQTERYLHVAENERDEVTAQTGILGNDEDATFRVYSSSGVGGVAKRHALAALCLHEQLFGFGHDDVDALRHAADGLEHHGIPWPQLYAIAARIEALLPPRPESE
jgi:hypothetical protein